MKVGDLVSTGSSIPLWSRWDLEEIAEDTWPPGVIGIVITPPQKDQNGFLGVQVLISKKLLWSSAAPLSIVCPK